ncbi:Uncharacterised BCR, YnfA/UPF0060 family [Fontibacillus panacisegetis]|uniref:Uncharacterized BCR, YnfA/UPF0060 family n=1 Tax=Fontibacillus panacisegetis TaxID=670482 RepID=A0A1G7GZ88_9BACL|nr:Uncharacterised BCR, YnfA/UPF0060 family [Fontibacillus panacisegetis]
MLISMLIFIIAGLAEIGGGYLVWLWLIMTTRPTGGLLLGYNPLLPNCA